MTARPPWSTYRVQLTPAFGFDQVAAIADYLAALGVSHLYASPYLQAVPGSTHGYDVVDQRRVSRELGGEAAHARMCEALGRAGLGQILDIVPNHMAIGVADNEWWWDVLENGPSSVYASYFDVDWDPPEQKLRNIVLMPILADHYGRVLDDGQLALRRDGGTFSVHYLDHVLPVAPRSLDTLLTAAAGRCGSDELESIGMAFGRLPPSTATDRESVRERHRDKEVLRARLAQMCGSDRRVAAALDAVVAELNADYDALDALLERQNYRLSFWRTAGRELDYRRFFDINTLIGLRVEDPQVFDDTHQLVLRWVDDGVLDGLRVDHPDGMRDPEGYLRRLEEASDGTWVAVEKILARDEELPPSWPVSGTTGYDYVNLVGGLFVDPTGEAPLTELYEEVTGLAAPFAEVAVETKRRVMRDVLAADLIRLSALFAEVCERHRRYRDYPRNELHEVLTEVIASFPAYRTYVHAEAGRCTEADRAHVDAAVSAAAGRRPDLDPELFTFLRDLLVLHLPGLGPVDTELVMRFQQTTGPVMAKGVEDTAFYVYNRFVALNEVGGDPAVFGTPVSVFHAACRARVATRPHSMLASSTHDTKRSEDVRSRLAVLSEIPAAWAGFVRRAIERNQRHRRGPAPDRNAEYLLYQTLVGAWPLGTGRAVAYMEKASKEAKVHTSWIDPDSGYDTALREFVEAVCGDEEFQAMLADFVGPLVGAGRVSSLAATLLKLTSPGVADTYQGGELWDLSLVDPDNRRPVDYATRRRLLEELSGMKVEDVQARADEGLPKLLVVTRALHARVAGDYVPLTVAGARAGHVVAFARGGRHATIVPRLVWGLAEAGGSGDTTVELPPGEWRNLFTGEDARGGPVAVGELTERFPVALLEAR